jgi:hypothetical protein
MPLPAGNVVRKVIADGYALAKRVKRRYQDQRKMAGQTYRLYRRLIYLPRALCLPILTTIVATNQPTDIPKSAPPSTSLG